MNNSYRIINYTSWLIALLAMVISLTLSEVMKLPPCTLCWYQRVFMYPLVLIIPIGIISKDPIIFIYSCSLSFVGLVISIYHALIYHGLIQESLKLCNAELSCKTKQFELFGFVSIPVMSFLSFAFIFIFNLIGVFRAKRN